AVPIVEGADDRDAPRVWRPHGEMHAGHALELHGMRAQLVEQAQMRALTDIVVVHRPEHGPEAVRIVDIPLAAFICGMVADGLAPIDFDLALEKAGIVALEQVAERLAVARISGHGLGVGDEGACHPDTVGLLEAQDREGIGILPPDDLIDLIGMSLPLLHYHAP